MAIRIRTVDGHIIALCAAKTKPKPRDLYLGDGVHEALATKFAIDWNEAWANPRKAKLMKKEELNE